MARPSTVIPKNVWFLWMYSFFSGIIFFQPILSVYLFQELVNLTEVSSIFAIEAILVVIFEIPSGALADIYGRKTILILSTSFRICALLFLFVGHYYVVFLLNALFNALAQSMESGTIEAILYDSLQISDGLSGSNQNDLNPPQKPEGDFKNYLSFKQANAINAFLWPLAASIASLFGGYLSTISYRTAIAATFIPAVICILTLVVIKDPHSKPNKNKIDNSLPSEISIKSQIQISLKEIHQSRQVKILFLSGFLVFAFAEVAFQFKGLFFEAINLPLYQFGIFSTLSFAMSFLGSLFSHPISKKWNEKGILICCQVFLGVFILISTFIPHPFISGVFLSLESFFWGLRWPIQSDWLNSQISSKNRATVNSVASMANRIGFAIFSPLLGLFGEYFSMISMFRLLGALEIVTIFLLFTLKRREK